MPDHRRTGPRRRVRRVIAGLLAVVLLPVVALWLLQRRVVFQPDSGSPGSAASFVPGARDVRFSTADGLTLDAWYLPAAEGCTATVLVAPGNAGNRGGRAELMRRLGERGLGVLLLDYRGYGGNPGHPTEQGLLLDATAAADFARAEIGSTGRLVYFGESLGGAVLTAVATTRAPSALLLRSPFADLAAAAGKQFPWLPVRLMLWDEFPVRDIIGGLNLPVTVVYGERDSLIPPDQSRAVAQAAGGRLVAIDGADHNDAALVHGPDVIDAVVAAADCQ